MDKHKLIAYLNKEELEAREQWLGLAAKGFKTPSLLKRERFWTLNEINEAVSSELFNNEPPENWEQILHKEYGLSLTVDGKFIKGYNQDGEFYWDFNDLNFLLTVFDNIMCNKIF